MGENLTRRNRIPSFHLKIKLTYENCFSVLLALIWANNTLVNYLRLILIRTPYISEFSEYIVSFVFLAATLMSMPYIIRHIDPWWILFYFGVVIAYLLNLLLFPNNQKALTDNMFPFLIQVLPLIFVGMCVNLKKHYRLLYAISTIAIIIQFIRLLLNPTNMIYGDMHSSYSMLPHVCLVMVTMFAKINIINAFVSVLGIIMTFAFGTRGPVFCILFLVIAYMIFFRKVYRHIGLFCFLFVLTLGVVFLYEEIMALLLGIVERMGMSTRIFDMLLSGRIIDSTGRDTIQATLLVALKQNWLGYGIAGDRAIAGAYAHNLMLELWISFGVLGGTALLIILVFYLTKLLIRKGESPSEGDGLILVLVASSFIKLFMSGSYLTEPLLFLLIGVVIAEYRKSRIADYPKVDN